MQPFQVAEFVDRRFDSIDFEHFCQNCAVLLFNRADTKNCFIGFFLYSSCLSKRLTYFIFSTWWRCFRQAGRFRRINIYIRYSKNHNSYLYVKPCLNGQWVCRLSRICHKLWNFSTFTRGNLNISKCSNVVLTSWYWHVIPDFGHRIKSSFF